MVAAAQTFSPGPQVVTFLSDVDDSDQPYALYVPRNYSPDRTWPLVVSLHGAGSNHRLNLRRVFGKGNLPGESDVLASRVFPPLGDVDYIVASPLARGDMGYRGIGEKDVLDVLADVKRRFRVDPDRVYLTGLSLGGGGALWLGMTRPDIWAAVAAVCPAVPDGLEELAGNLQNVPVKVFQGEIDPVVPAVQTRAWVQRLRDAGVAVEYAEYRSVRHNAWDTAYRDRAIFEWFGHHRRVSKPTRVQFAADSYARASAYWLRLEKLTPGTAASATAELRDRRLEVSTKNLSGFRVDTAAAPSRPVSAVIDGQTVTLRQTGPLVFRRDASGKGWSTAGATVSQANEKQPGAEGPVGAATSVRHVYVYGTEDNPEVEELIRRRETAMHAANWSSPKQPLQLQLKVLADKEVRDAEYPNQVLFGNRLTNGRLAALAPRLPFHLNPSAADYGLVYVYPSGGGYVVVSSGLPWWTRLDQANRPGLPWVAPAWRTLQSFGDFILFRGGLDHVIVEGRFDNQWQLPAEALEKMRATGVVEFGEGR